MNKDKRQPHIKFSLSIYKHRPMLHSTNISTPSKTEVSRQKPHPLAEASRLVSICADCFVVQFNMLSSMGNLSQIFPFPWHLRLPAQLFFTLDSFHPTHSTLKKHVTEADLFPNSFLQIAQNWSLDVVYPISFSMAYP